VSYPRHHQHNTHPLQVRRYQCEAKLQRWAGRWPNLRLGLFRSAHADGDPRLPAEDVTKRGKVPRQRRMGRWSHSLLSVFILLFIIVKGVDAQDGRASTT
jgi:hypothetical protein